ncbi:penicillin-binding protein 1C [Lichenihabitans psoromatis]|uniref:penicillin-binding protein 1C n=1 Tax=Lichenihabitans psoromatis TaxID=2528642 RepID=UPI00103842FE|nr:penicillin-binding protein 1C [Lichenihabitans psoromatis]
MSGADADLTGPKVWGGRLTISALVVVVVVSLGVLALDRLFPPDFTRLAETSTVVLDRSDVPLRVFTTKGGLWRLRPDPDTVSLTYRDLLVDIEDKRFWFHPGVDPLALIRASLQVLTHGRVVSGGSTLTMQVVRLLEPRPRTLRSKLIEIVRAIQLETRLSKRDILQIYLTLAPMGGNVEGVRAGSLAWFGKEPSALSDAEAALLVALPQNPTGLRPDRRVRAAEAARAKVLRRGAADGIMARGSLRTAMLTPVPTMRHAMPALAPHLAEQLAGTAPAGAAVRTTIDHDLQDGAERILAQALGSLPRPVNVAAIMADWQSGEVVARVGSGDYFDGRRSGAIDLTQAVRSPGSTLKPFIYGMAFDGLLAHPASLVRDAATRFDDYAPHNFDGGFNGDVTVRQALQMSLNLPAVVTLQRLGPLVFTERFKQAGLPLAFGDTDAAPGLPVALGGAGTTLQTLVTAYAALARAGEVNPLTTIPGAPRASSGTLMGRAAADAIVDILSDMPPPGGFGARAGRIAFKTGTSYRFRDGWAIGFDQHHAIGVWMGRADGGTCAACVGVAAAQILFRLFDLLPPDPIARRRLEPVFAGPPPPALVRLDATSDPNGDRPRISFPIEGSRLLVDGDAGAAPQSPVKLSALGGQRPYRWLVDGQPIESRSFAREALWRPEGEGFTTVTVVDAAGHSDRATVRILARRADPVEGATGIGSLHQEP